MMKIQSQLASFVIPAHNEALNLPVLLQRIRSATSEIPAWTYEILIVNDGSSDNTIEVVKSLQREFSQVILINLSRNFGHQAALEAGLWQAKGDVVICLDGDCQHPPEMIPEMLAAYEAGAEIVQMVRKRKQEGFKGWLSKSFYRIFEIVGQTDMVPDGSDFRLISRRILTLLAQIPESSKFLRALLPSLGFKQVAIPYDESARYAGRASYTFRQSTRLARKAFFEFSTFPLKLVFYSGVSLAAFGFTWTIFHLLYRMVHNVGFYPDYTDVVVLLFFMSGCILGAIGIVGRYIKIILEQIRGRPPYVIASIEPSPKASDVE